MSLPTFCGSGAVWTAVHFLPILQETCVSLQNSVAVIWIQNPRQVFVPTRRIPKAATHFHFGYCLPLIFNICIGWGWQPPQTAFTIYIRHDKVFEQIDMLSIGIPRQHYTVLSTEIGSDVEFRGDLCSQNDFNMSWLRLTATSYCLPHPYWTFTKCLSTLLVCCP